MSLPLPPSPTPPASAESPADQAYRPRYAVGQDVHERHRFIERADWELRLLGVAGPLQEEMSSDALVDSARAAARLAGEHLYREDVLKLFEEGAPPEKLPPVQAQAIRYAVFLTTIPRGRALPRMVDDLPSVHRELFEGRLPNAGEFRTAPGTFRPGPWSDTELPTTPPDRIATELFHLLSWAYSAPEHPLVRAEVFHHGFLRIHPFRDGNKLVAHALTAHLLHAWGYPGALFAPVAPQMLDGSHALEDAFLESVEADDLTPWIRYMSGVMKVSFGKAAERVHFRRHLPRDLGPRAVRVADWIATFNLFMGGIWVTFQVVHDAFDDIPRRSLQRDLKELVEAGVLEAHGTGRGMKYGLPGVVDEVEVGRTLLKELEERRSRGTKGPA